MNRSGRGSELGARLLGDARAPAVGADERHGGGAAGRWDRVTVPTAVIDGGKSPAWIRNANADLAAAVPGSTDRTLPGQTHMVKAGLLASAGAERFIA